ncbi:putative phage abortive infection protein [Candidatus Enterococcus leclercqii]
MEFLKKNKKFITWALIITLIIIPLVIQGVINWDTMNNGSDDGWLGFWGGYLGSIIGVVGALIVIQIQLSNEKERFEEETEARKIELEESKKRFDEETQARNKEFEEEKKARKSEQVDNTFFNLLNLFISQQNSLVSKKDTEQNIFDSMLNNIFERSASAYRSQGLELFYSRKKELISIIKEIIEASDNYIECRKHSFSEEEQVRIDQLKNESMTVIKPTDISNDHFEDVWGEIKRIIYTKNFQKDIEREYFKEMYPINSESFGIPEIRLRIDNILQTDRAQLLDDDSKMILINIDKELGEFLKFRPNVELSPERKRLVVENSQEPYRKQVGSYFRIFHRIMKYLNENVDDEQIKKNYVGFLRANMNENQMAMIFYNINYTERGSGAMEELKGTGFFGEKSELSDMKTAHFFSSETLVWGNYDLKKMQEFC